MKATAEKIPTKNSILLVEDDAIAQRAHRLMLKEMQYNVVCAASGAETIALCLENYFLILMDCGLPDMNGFEVSKEIRSLEKLHNVHPRPIVMVSAFELNAQFQQECLIVGIDKYIIKPISYDSLHDLVLSYIK